MLFSLASTALIMGLLGGPHCLAMCAAPCSAVVGAGIKSASKNLAQLPSEQPVRWIQRRGKVQQLLAYHSGRLTGYSTMGALAAMAMQSLAWLTQQTSALRPVWTLMHVVVLAWGLMMVLQSRQPIWVEKAGRAVWSRFRPVAAAPGGVFATGFLWALMPCGLLYSALLVAALSGGALEGALTMGLFALGSGAWLIGGGWLWGVLRQRLNAVRAEWGTQMAGGLLCAVAVGALWMDLIYRPSLWCR